MNTLIGRIQFRRDDSGIVAIWVAILAVVLFGMAAFAVDISRWYVETERLQKTVDAAALSGAVYLPGSLGAANSTGRATADANWRGTIDGTDVTYAGTVGGRPTQYKVTMSSEVDNAFAGVLGVPTTRLTRTAVAEFAPPVPMGSPCNLFGRNDMESLLNGVSNGTGPASQSDWSSPDCAGVGTYWVNTAGRYTNKARGDGFASGQCTKPDDGVGIDNCTGLGTVAAPDENTDYTGAGYTFIVRSRAGGTIDLEGYDIGWAAVGDNCNQYNLMGSTSGTRPTNQYVRTQAHADIRYKIGASPFCAGDTSMGGTEGDNSTVRTVVTVRRPSPQPWNPLAGEVFCTFDLPGWGTATPKSALQGLTGGDELLKRSFHRWTSLTPGCPSITASAGQDWSVQVQTIGGGGQNRYSLRARHSAGDRNVSIFAAGKVSLFNNVPAGTSSFKLVRLDSAAANHTLVVRFFDLGDATQPVTATVLQPDSDTPFGQCTGQGPVNGTLTDCSVVTTATKNGGRWQTIAIPIASDYTCSDDTDPAACWVRVRLSTSAGQSDTTTWTAALEGDPVRLVPDAS